MKRSKDGLPLHFTSSSKDSRKRPRAAFQYDYDEESVTTRRPIAQAQEDSGDEDDNEAQPYGTPFQFDTSTDGKVIDANKFVPVWKQEVTHSLFQLRSIAIADIQI